ncbi:MAG: hypothetical protein K2O08_02675 [Clostridia bacterium]|nr:hypothetical protein [Clostridia bacterium]
MRLSIKAKRNIGLLALTVGIIVAIIVVIVLVNKYVDGNNLTKGKAGQTISTNELSLTASPKNSLTEFGGKKAGEGNCFMLVEVTVKAKKKITLVSDKFSLSDGKAVKAQSDGYEFLDGKVEIEAGEEKTFYLLYEVKANVADSFYLYGYSCSVDMGGSIADPFS